MGFAENDHVVQTLAANAADQAFGERILPGRLRGNEHFLDAHAGDATPEALAVAAVAIPEEKARRLVKGKRLAELLRNPNRSWVSRDLEVNHAAAVVTKDDEDIKGKRLAEHPAGGQRAQKVAVSCDGMSMFYLRLRIVGWGKPDATFAPAYRRNPSQLLLRR